MGEGKLEKVLARCFTSSLEPGPGLELDHSRCIH
jgi:hypothetical protein